MKRFLNGDKILLFYSRLSINADRRLFNESISIIRYFIHHCTIFRYLQSKKEIGDNKLLFANKTQDDIILAEEFKTLLGKNFINILSDEKVDGFAHGQITEGFLKAHISDSTRNIFICGPLPMMDAIERNNWLI